MSYPHKQTGIVIVLLVIILSMLSIAVTGALPHLSAAYDHSAADPQTILTRSSDLLEARQALLSYTTLYPYLYGPGGAGPGHFPCPDIDGRQIRGETIWAQNLGPNPPCGSLLKSTGRLPNHISFSSHRYLVHSRLESDIDYQLSDKFVNNPVNRRVNPTTIQTGSSRIEPPIRLSTSMQSPGSSTLNSVATNISSAVVLASAKLSVASWTTQRLLAVYGLVCVERLFLYGLNVNRDEQPSAMTPPDHGDDIENEQCQRRVALLRQCAKAVNEESQRVVKLPAKIVLNLFSDLDLDDLQNTSDNELDCGWQDVPITNSTISIEGIPARRHWFYRNAWADWIQFHVSTKCIETDPVSCELTYLKPGELLSDSSDVLLSWGPKP